MYPKYSELQQISDILEQLYPSVHDQIDILDVSFITVDILNSDEQQMIINILQKSSFTGYINTVWWDVNLLYILNLCYFIRILVKAKDGTSTLVVIWLSKWGFCQQETTFLDFQLINMQH